MSHNLTETIVREAMHRLFICAQSPKSESKESDIKILLSFRMELFNGRLPENFQPCDHNALCNLFLLSQNAAYVLERNGVNPYHERES